MPLGNDDADASLPSAKLTCVDAIIMREGYTLFLVDVTVML